MTQASSSMKRSKTTYTASNSSFKCLDRDILESSPRSRKASFLMNSSFTSSSANASWGQSSSARPESSRIPQRARNVFLQNDTEINSLLTMLRSNEFTGEIDPAHHSQYMTAPKIDTSKPKPRRLGESYHRSDTHLLQYKQRGISAGN
jgi:hypothetical protein